MKYESEIGFVEVLISIMVLNLNHLSKQIKFDDAIIFEDNENMKCQYLGDEIKYETEIW